MRKEADVLNHVTDRSPQLDRIPLARVSPLHAHLSCIRSQQAIHQLRARWSRPRRLRPRGFRERAGGTATSCGAASRASRLTGRLRSGRPRNSARPESRKSPSKSFPGDVASLAPGRLDRAGAGRCRPDVVLQSAFPQRGSPSISGTLTAPVVFVGAGSAAEVAGRNPAGKIAVVHRKPDPGLFYSRGGLADVLPLKPAAIMVVIELPGNMQAFNSCAARGSRASIWAARTDSFSRPQSAPPSGRARGQLQMSVQLDDSARRNDGRQCRRRHPRKESQRGAHHPQRSCGRLLRGRQRQRRRPRGPRGAGAPLRPAAASARTRAVLVAAAGRSQPGGNGAAAFVARHPEIVGKTVFILNLEHIAQVNMQSTVHPPRRSSGYRDLVADAVEYPQSVGITRDSPFLFELFGRAARLYGKNVYTRIRLGGAGRSAATLRSRPRRRS